MDSQQSYLVHQSCVLLCGKDKKKKNGESESAKKKFIIVWKHKIVKIVF